jgi:hypothetical protein
MLVGIDFQYVRHPLWTFPRGCDQLPVFKVLFAYMLSCYHFHFFRQVVPSVNDADSRGH